MKTDDKQAIREVLASMIAEAPPPTDFSNLTEIQVVHTAIRPRRSPLVAALAGFAVAVAVIGSVIAITQRPAPVSISPGSGADASIFMVPGVIPDDLELAVADIWTDGFSTTQSFLLPGRTGWGEGDRVVNININNMVEQAGGDVAVLDLVTGDPEAFFEVLRQQTKDSYPDSQLTFDEITVRGRPALLVERTTTVDPNTPNGPIDVAIGVIVLEGNGIVSETGTHQIARDVAIAIAESLTPVTAEDFEAYTTTQP